MLLIILFSYTIPIDLPITENIEYLQLRGFIELSWVRPYEKDWLVEQLDQLLMRDEKLNDIDRRILAYFNPLLTKSEDFSTVIYLQSGFQSKPRYYYGLINEVLGGNLFSKVSFGQGIKILRANQLDSLGPKPWKNFQTYQTEGFIRWNYPRIKFYLGRRNFLLGYGPMDGLLLSRDPEGYDGFYLYIPGRLYEFQAIFTVLDLKEIRYLAIHRIGLRLKNFLRLGFSEAILFGHQLEPAYLNIFLPYYLSQWGTDRDDNILWCFDWSLSAYNSQFYGEFLIDDYMYEDDPYPDKLGYRLGLKSLLNILLLKVDYTFVDKWVYTQRHPINTYERNGHPLGFPLGNDVDRIAGAIKIITKFGFYPIVSITYIRKGEGSIFLPFEEEDGDWNPPFPSPVVERKLEIELGIDYLSRYNLCIQFKAGKRTWYNYNHIPDNYRNQPFIRISGSLFF
ncbi:hypothetical protein BXT86_05010 [candidate division WOR-3 bacterium 4484_100]|uniref:TonB-dependent receptor-like beta-barrel domain-containing protein n=1 Tax=candidate division WOR-3 bacterium 4484_100 TaxID=1936077 RepID=A0A1V4QFG6_UNCW3|nr:MAG: hypothetical protein BXT86_05010 [candidate division WOR-3 bacterium 4484_100]